MRSCQDFQFINKNLNLKSPLGSIIILFLIIFCDILIYASEPQLILTKFSHTCITHPAFGFFFFLQDYGLWVTDRSTLSVTHHQHFSSSDQLIFPHSCIFVSYNDGIYLKKTVGKNTKLHLWTPVGLYCVFI